MTKLPTANRATEVGCVLSFQHSVDTGDLAPGMKRQIWSPMSRLLSMAKGMLFFPLAGHPVASSWAWLRVIRASTRTIPFA